MASGRQQGGIIGEHRSRVTIKDVAAAARVSPMTVSNVLNGKFQFVSTATRLNVEREILRLGYRLQRSGRNLRDAKHGAVGMLIVDDSPSFLADPFTASVVAGLSNVLSRSDHALSVQGITPDRFSDARLFRHFDVDGFCVMLSGPKSARDKMVKALVGLRQPIVFFQEVLSVLQADSCVVRQDDFGGGEILGQHLRARGSRDVLLILPARSWSAMEQREQGLRKGLGLPDLDAPKLMVLRAEGEELERVQSALSRCLDTRDLPDTIVGGNDRMALAAMALLESREIPVPAAVRVAGFNAFEPRRYVRPLLTTIRSPAYAMGERAAELLLQRLKGVPFEAGDVLIPVYMEVGYST